MKKHILIADEDQLILYGLAKALKDDGCEVKTADTANEAIEKLSHCPYDLCLLDVHLADLNGLGLINIIYDICPETRVILMAAEPLDPIDFSETGSTAADQGAFYCIPKPFALNDVTETVKQVLAGEWRKYDPTDFFRTGPDSQSRKHKRKSCNEEICFGMSVIHEGVSTRLSMKGQLVDVSDGGIGLQTAYPIRESQVIGFDEKMANRIGVVVWSRMVDKESFRAGVRFA